MKLDTQDVKVIWFFFRSYKRQSLGVLALMFLSGMLDTFNLAALYPIINYGLNLEKKSLFLQSFDRASKLITSDNPFFASCILLILISIAAIAVKVLYNYLSYRLLIRIVGDTQKRIFEKYVAADYNFFVRNQQGKLTYAGTIAPERTFVVILYTITLFYHSTNALFLFSLLMLLNWQATLGILMLGFFYSVVIQKILQKFIHKCSAVYVEENQRKNVILNEFITGIKSIKIFLMAKDWTKKYAQTVERSLGSYFRMLMGETFPEAFIKCMFYVFLASAGIFLSRRPQSEIISLLPVFGTFVVVANRFLPSAHSIGSAVMRIAECLPDTKIVYDLCNEQVSTVPDGVKECSGFKERIAFENVSFKYGNMNEYLLKNLSFVIEKRKMTAIVGLSGSGKSTIINLLLKLYAVDKGAVTIDGTDISELSNKTYLSRIGYVSQETFIFNSSIKENIRFGLEDCSDQMIEEAALLANAHDFIMDTPQGYDTLVGDSGVKLSGGQRQRIAIARAMLRKPEIIVLDEATSSLDNISEKKIQKAINNISKHTTVLVIAHRLSTVQNADKIIILEKGEIKEQGTHEELLKNKTLYYDLHALKDSADGELAEEKIG